MNAIIYQLNQYAAQFLTSCLWPIVWQSAILGGIVALARWTVFRRASPQFRHLLWLLVVLRIFLPPSLALPTSVVNWGAGLLDYLPRLTSAQQASLPVSFAPLSVSPMAVSPQALLPSATSSQSAPSPLSILSTPSTLLALAWLAGVLILAALLVLKMLQLRRNLAKCDATVPESLRCLVDEQARRLGIARNVSVRISDQFPGPVVCGFWRPVVVIPARVLHDLSPDELAPVIVHELAHIRRRDYLVNWVQILAGVLYFFHPVLWFANRQIRIEREKACDDLVLVALGLNRKGYAGSLMKVLEQASRGSLFAPGFIGIVERRSNLGARIVRILDAKMRPTARLSLASVLLLVLFASTFLTFRTTAQAKPEADNKQETTKPALNLDREASFDLPQNDNDLWAALSRSIGILIVVDPAVQAGVTTPLKIVVPSAAGIRPQLKVARPGGAATGTATHRVPSIRAFLDATTAANGLMWQVRANTIQISLADPLEAKLNGPIRIEFAAAKKDGLWKHLSDASGIPIRLAAGVRDVRPSFDKSDKLSIEANSVQAEMDASNHLSVMKCTPLRDVLGSLVKSQGLKWERQGDGILISRDPQASILPTSPQSTGRNLQFSTSLNQAIAQLRPDIAPGSGGDMTSQSSRDRRVREWFSQYVHGGGPPPLVGSPISSMSLVWSDIPTLIDLAKNSELLRGRIPSSMLSSYIQAQGRAGMVALWLIEDMRRRERGLDVAGPGPLNPICLKVKPNPPEVNAAELQKAFQEISESEGSEEIHQKVLAAYRKWWAKAQSLLPAEAARLNPLSGTDLHWYGMTREADEAGPTSATLMAPRPQTPVSGSLNGQDMMAGQRARLDSLIQLQRQHLHPIPGPGTSATTLSPASLVTRAYTIAPDKATPVRALLLSRFYDDGRSTATDRNAWLDNGKLIVRDSPERIRQIERVLVSENLHAVAHATSGDTSGQIPITAEMLFIVPSTPREAKAEMILHLTDSLLDVDKEKIAGWESLGYLRRVEWGCIGANIRATIGINLSLENEDTTITLSLSPKLQDGGHILFQHTAVRVTNNGKQTTLAPPDRMVLPDHPLVLGMVHLKLNNTLPPPYVPNQTVAEQNGPPPRPLPSLPRGGGDAFVLITPGKVLD